jgi:anti-anti-sigma regulatory factor
VTAWRPSRGRRSIVVRLDAALTPDDVRPLCARARRLLEASGARVLVCDAGVAAADCVAVDAIARLQLTAGRLGCRLQLRHASRELWALLELTGLRGIVPAAPVSGVLADTEEREEALRVEERVHRDDPPV